MNTDTTALLLINAVAMGAIWRLLWLIRKTQLQERTKQEMAAIDNLRANVTELQGTANDTVAEVRRLKEGNEVPVQAEADRIKAINDQLKAELPAPPEA